MLSSAKSTIPSAATAAVTLKSTTCFATTLPAVTSAGPSITGRVRNVVVVSGHVWVLIAWTAPPAALPSLLLAPTVRRRSACWTLNPPMPFTRKRKNAWRTGDVPTSTDVVVPNFVVAAPPSTYVSAIGRSVSCEGTTATTTLALAAAPSASVTEAVSVWVPTDRLGTTSAAPLPRTPSRLDVQRTLAPRFPSSTSVAAATRSAGRAVSSVACGAGTTTAIAGGTLGGRTTTVRCARAARPPVSATLAVTT